MSHSSKVLAAVLCTMASVAPCFAQPNNSFSIITGSNNIFVSSTDSSSPTPHKIYAVDLNNDGVPDLVQDEVSYDSTYGDGQFAVSIANGDGTFKPPVAVNYPPGVAYYAPMAFGDFNNDGNIDIAMPVWGKPTLAIYLGKGDGTFVNPWYFNLTLPAGQVLDGGGIVAADFGRHGETDLAVTASDSTNSNIYVLPGSGNGVFQAVHPVLTVPTQSGFGDPIISMAVGDFDGDDNTDIVASVIAYYAGEGTITNTTVHVLYGEGGFDMIDATPYSVAGGEYPVGAADLDSDGFSDFYVLDTGAWVLQTFYGESGRGFDQHSTAIPSANYSDLAVADFNDDGHMDLISTSSSYMIFLRGESDRGQFTTQTWNLPSGNGPPQNPNGYITAPVAGDFNHDDRPDFVVARYVDDAAGTSTVDTGLNTSTVGLWSDCNYPTTAHGIMNCSPVPSSGTTVNFNATAHSFGALRKIELWVDGQKLGEQYHTWGDNGAGNAWFNFSTTLAAGSHQGTYFAVDVDNRLQQSNFNFTIPSTCAAPASAGVHLCSPSNGTSQPSGPVNVGATSTVTGTLARMEIWVDSTKQYTETNSTSLWAAVQVPHGQHTITVFAVNTGGTVWSQAASVTLP